VNDDLRRSPCAPRISKRAGWRTAALLYACAALTGCAQDTSAPALEPKLDIADAWAPATPPNVAVGAAYVQIDSTAADTLLGGETPVARTVEIHQTTHEDGMMKMRQLESLPIAAGGSTRLEPHGAHLMLIDLVEPLAAGETFPLTLHFAQAGEVVTEVTVMAPETTPEPAHEHR
jgi:copper(I)-binding protein